MFKIENSKELLDKITTNQFRQLIHLYKALSYIETAKLTSKTLLPSIQESYMEILRHINEFLYK